MRQTVESQASRITALHFVHEEQVPITWEQIETYLAGLYDQDYAPDTLKNYRRNLKQFFNALPPEKTVDSGSAARWRESLLAQGKQIRTVNQQLTAVNEFLGFQGLRAFQLSSALALPDDTQPELTRNEYLRLLTTAKALGKERTYLLIKMFAAGGLTICELSGLAAEGVAENRMVLTANRTKRIFRLPECLRRELLAYMNREGIRSGPVFLSQKGKPIDRKTVTAAIQSLARDARVAQEKCNPRCLRKLYQTTRKNIWQHINLLAEQAHERLLEEEQLTVGWEEVNDDAC